MESSNKTDVQLRAMALLASLRTAAEVCHTMALRRRGMDPSDQQDADHARHHLRAAIVDLREIMVQLRLSMVVDHAGEAGLIRAFEDRMMLARAARELHIVHQHLLSLYPAVDPELVERARIVQAEAARLTGADDDGFHEALAIWTDGVGALTTELSQALKRG